MNKKLLRSVREYKKQSILAPLLVILEVLMEVLIPLEMAKIIDVGIAQGNLSYILQRGIILVVMAMLSLFFGVQAGNMAAYAAAGYAKNLRHDIFYKVQDFSFKNIDHFSTSGLVTRMTTDMTRSKAVSKYSRPELFSSYRYIYQNAPMDYLNDQRTEYDLTLRLLRVQLDDGSYENIATNLPEEEFKAEDFKALYHLRWQEENSFRDLKYSLCLKAFHSKKYDYIVQEVWARVILYNFSSSIIINVTVDREDRAYEYQANYSSALKTCRDFLRIHDGITKINVESLIAQNIEPIRPGRTFARQHRFKLPMSFCYRH